MPRPSTAAGGLLLLALLAACSAPPAPAPRVFSVARGFVRDPDGRAVILRGANVSGRHKAPPYFDFHGPDDYARMRAEWGMSSVRFLVEWAAVEPQRDAYDEAYLDELVRRVRRATDAGLLVFLDMHQDVYGEGFGHNGAPRWTCDEANYAAYQPTSPWFLNYVEPHVIACYDGFWGSRDLQAKYGAAWARVAARFVDAPNVIGLDPMNEPYWGSMPPDVFEQRRLAPLYRQVLAAVRAHRPDWLGFLEPAASRNLGLATRLPVFEEQGLVYAPHSYDGDAESGRGFDPARRQVLLDTVKGLADEAAALGLPLLVGEYGGTAAHPGIGAYMDAQYAAAGAVAAGAMYWHFGKDDGYGLLAADGSDKPELLAAVARPYPERVAGEPVEWSFDAATATFRVTWRVDAAVKAPTLVAVPRATWPSGVTAECDGCAVALEEGRVAATASPGAATATLTLRAR